MSLSSNRWEITGGICNDFVFHSDPLPNYTRMEEAGLPKWQCNPAVLSHNGIFLSDLFPFFSQIGLFPGQCPGIDAEMPIACSVPVERCSKLQLFNDCRRTQINGISNQILG